jgi:hypothetical protein
MKNNTDMDVFSRSIVEYQPLFLYRREDEGMWSTKQNEGLLLPYISKDGTFHPWNGEKILYSFENATINIKDDSFESRMKKMRIAKRAPRKWKVYITSERIVAVIPFSKTMKIGDIVELFTTSVKRVIHRGEYIMVFLPHSMLAGIVIRLKQGVTCKHIALVYKHQPVVGDATRLRRLAFQDRIVNYTLYLFDFAEGKEDAEKLSLDLQQLSATLQNGLLYQSSRASLLSHEDKNEIQQQLSENLRKGFQNNWRRDGILLKRNYLIETLFVGGIPHPIYPREDCNSQAIDLSRKWK